MPRPARRPPELVGAVFRARTVLDSGLLTKQDLRSKAWRRLFRGVYADARAVLTYADRCAAYTRHLLPPDAAIGGRSAARLYGVAGDGGEPLTIVRGLPAGDVTVLDDSRVTIPARTCWDLARREELADAVALVDAFLSTRLVTVERLEAYARAHPGSRGCRQLRRVVAFADGGSGSPWASRLRVRVMLAGMPKPVHRPTLTYRGDVIGVPEFAWPAARVAVEHVRPGWPTPTGDRLARADWQLLPVTEDGLRDDPDGFLTELRHTLRVRTSVRRR